MLSQRMEYHVLSELRMVNIVLDINQQIKLSKRLLDQDLVVL